MTRVFDEMQEASLSSAYNSIDFSDITYRIVTFGCQMNKSDTERIAGMLDALGAFPETEQTEANLIIFMTCCVREAADERLYGQVASLKNSKAMVAVGGCIGQRDAADLVKKMPHISIVFGTHNTTHLPALIKEARESGTSVVEVLTHEEALQASNNQDDSSISARREHAWHAWLPIMTGCNNFCSYCVVPYVRGREQSQPFEKIVEDTQKLVADGVREITLLGQNVNSYGRDLYGDQRFAELLDVLGNSGVDRLRFATSHPKDLSKETIEVFANTPAIMPALHLPAQSGSSQVLKEMNRKYTSEHYLDLIRQVKSACKAAGKEHVAFSTDIIVGFPGETEEDFEQTMQLVKEVGFAQVFTFIYSKREGTPAAKLQDDTPREIISERFDRLVALVQECAWQFNQHSLGNEELVLFEGVSKRNKLMLTGRSPKNQTVHAPLPEGRSANEFAGEIYPVKINEAKTWFLRGDLL